MQRDETLMATVVVVEDDMDVRDLVVMTLEHSGHQVLAVDNGASGLELCLRERPDVLVLDERMPLMSGLEVLATIRTSARYATLRDLPVLMVSAKTLPSDRDEAFAVGADAFLSKPFSPRQLAELVEHLAVQATPSEHTAAVRLGRQRRSSVTADSLRRPILLQACGDGRA